MRTDLLDDSKWPEPVARKSDGKLELWVCTRCTYVYDPRDGDDCQDIPPGVPFEALPEDWICPDCGAEKEYFFF